MRAFPQGKIRVPHSLLLRIAGNALAVQRIFVTGGELKLELYRCTRLRWTTGRGNDVVPSRDELAGRDGVSRDCGGADDLGAEDVVIFDLNLEVGKGMR